MKVPLIVCIRMSAPGLSIHLGTTVQQKCSVAFLHSWLYTLGGFGLSHYVLTKVFHFVAIKIGY